MEDRAKLGFLRIEVSSANGVTRHEYLVEAKGKAPPTAPPACGIEDLSCQAADSEILLTWRKGDEERSDCGSERTEVRDGASGDLIAVLPGGASSAAILCRELPGEGTLRVIRVGGDGSRSQRRCEYVCAAPELRRPFVRADCNADGTVDIADPVASLLAIFLGAFEIPCEDACDSNGDMTVDISDPITTLAALFLGNARIPVPGTGACGVDPTDDDLTCESFAACRGNH